MPLLLFLHNNIITILFLLLIATTVFSKIEKTVRFSKSFLTVTIIVCVQLIIETLIFYFSGIPGQLVHRFLYTISAIYFILGALLAFFWLGLIKGIISPYKSFSTYEHTLFYVAQIANITLVIVTFFTGSYFKITSDNTFIRGPLFYVHIAFVFIYTIPTVYHTIKNQKIVETECRGILVAASILPLLGAIIQLREPKISLVWSVYAFGLVLLLFLIQKKTISLDYLTNAWQRRSLIPYVNHRLLSADYFSGLFIDIDNLKGVNDKYGHNTGDLLIKKIVEKIKSVADVEAIARIGGDEFIIILNTTCETELKNKIKDIKDKVYQINSDNVFDFDVSISIGGAIFDHHYLSFEDFMAHIDVLMYQDKRDKPA